MTDQNVTSLFGGPVGVPEPNDACIKALEEMLEAARAGEIIGVACGILHKDGLAAFRVSGRVGSYGMIGAIDMAKHHVLEASL